MGSSIAANTKGSCLDIMVMAQRIGLKVGLTGFAIAIVGAVTGFGEYEIDQRWLSLTGVGITAVGAIVGFIGIVYGWITEGNPS